ncbi:AMP-dependent synthetase/ligase [Actinoplanes sp. HUAS TT8]|uniref:AMP-dependent synthetase/ligase n=1 Tax=Actinoplanes sp. HUAS TT8 TaxID=3447453 RepID=UPI003F524F19
MTTPATSVGARFLDRCADFGDTEAFRHPGPGDAWSSLTWTQVAERVTGLAAGLLTLGVSPGDRVAIAASTRIEWVLADLAVMCAGAATTTVYPTTSADDVAYILDDSRAVVVFAEDAGQVAKLRTSEGGWISAIRHVVVLEPVADPDVLTISELIDRGRREDPEAVRAVLHGLDADAVATIVYTSGTTGRPKGVELTHGNWLSLGAALAGERFMHGEHLHFLWLPLSHVFGKLLLAAQYEIGFVTAIDGRADRIIDNLATLRPTVMAAAPRIFEKMYSRVATTAGRGRLSRALFRWAFALDPAARWRRRVADRLVFARIRALLGGRLQILFSGSAALSPQIAEWFARAGLPILEGYGLTEATGVSFFNRPGRVRAGTVGQAVTGTEVRIADDGEILLRGPGVMRGYHRLPEETAAAVDLDGWFATGDIGELGDDGYLRITDRKKDLVKTSGGKYIAPTAIESALKAACPLVSAAVLIADGRNFASLLVALDPDAARGLSTRDAEAAVRRSVDEVNRGLNRWETVKQFRILPRELSIEAGEMTPSLKVKRAVVARNHAGLIDEMYAGPARP